MDWNCNCDDCSEIDAEVDVEFLVCTLEERVFETNQHQAGSKNGMEGVH